MRSDWLVVEESEAAGGWAQVHWAESQLHCRAGFPCFWPVSWEHSRWSLPWATPACCLHPPGSGSCSGRVKWIHSGSENISLSRPIYLSAFWAFLPGSFSSASGTKEITAYRPLLPFSSAPLAAVSPPQWVTSHHPLPRQKSSHGPFFPLSHSHPRTQSPSPSSAATYSPTAGALSAAVRPCSLNEHPCLPFLRCREHNPSKGRTQSRRSLVKADWQLSLVNNGSPVSLFNLSTGPLLISRLGLSPFSALEPSSKINFLPQSRLLPAPGLSTRSGTFFLLLCTGPLSTSSEKQLQSPFFQEHPPWPLTVRLGWLFSESSLRAFPVTGLSSCLAVIVCPPKLPWSREDRARSSPVSRGRLGNDSSKNSLWHSLP